MSAGSLEPLAPGEAVGMYLSHRKSELSDSSLQSQEYRLNAFVEFCGEHGIENLNNLTGRDLHRFRKWRQEDVNEVTLRGNLATLRVFLEFCASVDGVEQGLRERVKLPNVAPEDAARDAEVGEEQARQILDYLEKFEYGSREHVIFGILWHTGIRLGTLQAIDVDDFDADDRCFDLRHRPDEGTPLKNGTAAERSIAVGEFWAEVLRDYIDQNRHDVTDEYGRRPLITSEHGRLTQAPMRRIVYILTQPCLYSDCPHGEDRDTCDAREYGQESTCPSARSPHSIRRGAITKHLRDGTPEQIVSDRMNVSQRIIDRHYDQRSDREKMRLRRDFLENA